MTGLEDRFAAPLRFADASDQAHDLVRSQLGDADFGPTDYLDGLRVLLMSMDYDPHFSERGRRIAWGEVYSGLFGRAHAYTWMRNHPALGDAKITRPLVITGMPRTGTTALHKLLAVDPQFQGLQGWLIAAPQPRPPRETWESNPLFQNAVERMAMRHASKPGSRAAHDMAAEEVDECLGVLRQGFRSNLWTCAWSAATYDVWLQSNSEKPCYEHLHRVLQLIARTAPDQRWLLKNPGHIAHLDLLLETFPDALVVQTHRDPAKAIASLCGLLIKNHTVMEIGRAQERAHIMGVRETEKWAKAIRDAEPVRQARAEQILDVVHAEFHRDPLGVVERIYAFAQLELTPAVRAAMCKRIADDPERQHGVHHYDIADFGLTEAAVRERFGDYAARFGLYGARP